MLYMPQQFSRSGDSQAKHPYHGTNFRFISPSSKIVACDSTWAVDNRQKGWSCVNEMRRHRIRSIPDTAAAIKGTFKQTAAAGWYSICKIAGIETRSAKGLRLILN